MDIRNMNKYYVYVFPPLFYLCVALAGKAFTSQGIGSWYQTIAKPTYTPPGSLIGAAWTIIFILSTVSLILFLKHGQGRPRFRLIISLYICNGLLNAAWSYLFFTKHLLGLAVIDAGLIAITVLLIILWSWHYSRLAAALLIPYFGWVSFATYLTYVIFKMN